MADEGIQKRRYPRYRTDVPAMVYQGAKSFTARVVQISRGGCLIYPPVDSRQGNEIKLSLQLGAELPSINCRAEIVYSINDRGSGVAFSEISLYNQDRISEYCEKNLVAEPA